jgi:hypothetical protein
VPCSKCHELVERSDGEACAESRRQDITDARQARVPRPAHARVRAGGFRDRHAGRKWVRHTTTHSILATRLPTPLPDDNRAYPARRSRIDRVGGLSSISHRLRPRYFAWEVPRALNCVAEMQERKNEPRLDANRRSRKRLSLYANDLVKADFVTIRRSSCPTSFALQVAQGFSLRAHSHLLPEASSQQPPQLQCCA